MQMSTGRKKRVPGLSNWNQSPVDASWPWTRPAFSSQKYRVPSP